MNKKEKQIQSDAEFLRGYIKTGTEIPETLSAESIENIISGKKQIFPVKTNLRRFVSVAAAVAVMVTAGVFTGLGLNGIKQTEDYNRNENIVQPVSEDDYDGIVEIISGYMKKRETVTATFSLQTFVNSFDKSAQQNGAVPAESAADRVYSAEAGTSSVTHSKLNTRDSAVAEADVAITDGEYIYVCSSVNGCLFICPAGADGKTEVASVINAYDYLSRQVQPGGGYYVYSDCLYLSGIHEMFLHGNYLVVTADDSENRSGALIFDISDKAAPKLVRKIFQDGFTVSARIADNRLYLVSSYCLPFCEEVTAETCIPRVYNGEKSDYVPADGITVADSETPERYIMLTTVPLDDIINSAPDTKAVLGTAGNVYCTEDRLFVYGEKWTAEDGSRESITAFDLTGETPRFIACGAVDGFFYDSFSIDWNGEYLRLACNDGEKNNLYILDGGLKEVGRSEDFGKGETIHGIRFMGDTAYIVTFRNTDPLFVMDLSKPEKPEILGQLEMPGFSDYLHPVGDGLLLGIGTGGTETGADDSAKATLYDVADPKDPKELSSVIIEHASFQYEYKAFTQVPGENAYLVPVYGFETVPEEYEFTYYAGNKCYSGAVKLSVTEDKKLVLSSRYILDNVQNEGIYVTRALVIDGRVFCVSPDCGIYTFENEACTARLSFRQFIPENETKDNYPADDSVNIN